MDQQEQQELNDQLIKSAKNGKLEEVKELLGMGADIEARDVDGWTALLGAALKGHVEIVTELLERGADIEAKDNYGWTALYIATARGRVEEVKELLERGADIEAKDNDNWTALHFAAYYNKLEVVKELLKRGAEPDLYTLSKYPKEVQEIKWNTSADVWSDILFFVIKEQEKYSKEDFKELVLEFLDKMRAEIPENIYIILSTLI